MKNKIKLNARVKIPGGKVGRVIAEDDKAKQWGVRVVEFGNWNLFWLPNYLLEVVEVVK